MLHRLGWALSGALAVVAILALARATVAGPLDPPGPVGSTMRTLDELAPSWGKTLTSSGGCSSQRFQCVMTGNAAVLDRETGLVWLRNPVETGTTYDLGRTTCVTNETGGRTGWRLPTSTEVFSLVDTSPDSLPDGHPFQNVSGGPYWTSTVNPNDDQLIQTVGMFGGFNEELVKPRFGGEGGDNAAVWCVRGGQSIADDPAPAEQPAWTRTLSADGGCESPRFDCVMGDLAVLDRETGLVWQRTPSPSLWSSWSDAQNRCYISPGTGGRHGWRLPTIEEALSLILPFPNNGLPPGHPFVINPPLDTSPIATSSSASETAGYGFTLSGSLNTTVKGASFSYSAWCVRGSGGDDGY